MHRTGLLAGLALLTLAAAATAQPQRENKPRFALNTGGHTGMVRTLAFSPGSDRLYSAGDDKVAYGWEIRDRGRRVRRIDAVIAQALRWQISRGLRGVVYSLAASPVDRRLAMAGISGADANGDIVIYDTALGQVETFLDGHRQTVTALAFSPDGTRLASMSADGELRIWTAPVAPGGAWRSQALAPPRQVTWEYLPLAFLDNRLLATAAPADAAGAVWRLALYDLAAPGAAPRILGQPHEGAITALAADPQGGRWASADMAGKVFLWQTGPQPAPRLLRQGRRALSLCFGAGDQVFVATKLDAGQNPSSYIELYSAATGQLIDAAATGADADNFACVVSPDRRFLATCGDSLTPVLIYPLTDSQDAPIPAPLSRPPFGKVSLRGEGEPMGKVAFTNDNTYRLGVGGISKVLFNDYGDVEYVFDSRRSDLRPVGEAAAARFLSPETGNRGWRLTPVGQGERKFRLNFSFGGRHYCHIDLDPKTQGAIRSHCWLGDAKGTYAVAIGTDHQSGIFIYRLANEGHCPLLRYYRDHAGFVTSISASPDRRYLASAAMDQTVKLWSLEGLTGWDESIAATSGAFRPAAAWGAAIELRNEGVVVASVSKSGIAATRGLQAGDRIIAVEFNDGSGAKVAADAPSILGALNSSPLTETLVLTFERGGVVQPKVLLVPAWEPLATLFVSRRGQWAFFTPQGPYDASVDGEDMFGFHFNTGRSFTPDFFRAAQFRQQLEQPDVLRSLIAAGNLRDATLLARRGVPPQLDNQVSPIADKTPSIRILEPRDGHVVLAGRQPVLRVEVDYPSPESARRYQPKASVNGSLILEPPAENDKGNGTLEFVWSLASVDPFNRVTVRFDEQSAVAAGGSPDRAVSFRAPAPQEPPRMYLYTLAAINYPGALALQKAVDDAERIRDTLKRGAGAVYLVDDSLMPHRRNEQITRETIERDLKRLNNPVHPFQSQDLLVVFLAGHGVAVDGEFYYVPPHPQLTGLDERNKALIRQIGIPWRLIVAALEDLRCRRLVMLDTCHSGNAILQADALATHKTSVRQLKDAFVLTFTATDRDQFATEDAGGGLFTQCLLRGLEGGADERGDGEVDLEEIVGYVGRELPKLSRKTQSPQFSSTQLLNEILFVPLTAIAAPAVADDDPAPARPATVPAPVVGADTPTAAPPAAVAPPVVGAAAPRSPAVAAPVAAP